MPRSLSRVSDGDITWGAQYPNQRLGAAISALAVRSVENVLAELHTCERNEPVSLIVTAVLEEARTVCGAVTIAH